MTLHRLRNRLSKSLHDGSDDLNRMAPDEAYLSYYDVRLTKEDVDCIKGDWLTDNVIAFWEEFLEHEKMQGVKPGSVILLRPAMVFLLMNTSEPTTLRGVLPDCSSAKYVFLPINDNRNVEVAEGGSHWSLLVVDLSSPSSSLPSQSAGIAHHYDSLQAANRPEAITVTRKFATFLGRPLSFFDMDTPDQNNGSDCGVFVCMEMRYLLLRRLLAATNKKSRPPSLNMSGLEIAASQGRKYMLNIIEEFRKEGERRRSGSLSPKTDRSKSPPRIGYD